MEEDKFEKCDDCKKDIDKNTFENNEGYCDECWTKRQPETPLMKAGRIL